jgi:hypothetical protein
LRRPRPGPESAKNQGAQAISNNPFGDAKGSVEQIIYSLRCAKSVRPALKLFASCRVMSIDLECSGMTKTELETLRREVLDVIATSIADVRLGKQYPIDAANNATHAIIRKVASLLDQCRNAAQ